MLCVKSMGICMFCSGFTQFGEEGAPKSIKCERKIIFSNNI